MRFVRITWREILIIMKRVEKNEQFGLVIIQYDFSVSFS
jgi:hypothetical protein